MTRVVMGKPRCQVLRTILHFPHTFQCVEYICIFKIITSNGHFTPLNMWFGQMNDGLVQHSLFARVFISPPRNSG